MINRLRLYLSRNRIRWLYDHVYYSRWISGGRRFFNAGILPVDEEVRRLPFARGDEDQAQVYYEVLKTYRRAAGRAAPRKVLELGVGLGGGIALFRAFCPASEYFGLDLSHAAIRRAREHVCDGLVVANLLHAPFVAHTFDLILGIEASPGVQLPQLFAEPKRLLSADGFLVLVDTRDLPGRELQEWLRAMARLACLAMVDYTDLTANLLQARTVDLERNRRLEKWPLPGFRSAVREMTAAEGSKRYARYARGELTYFVAAFAHAAPLGEKAAAQSNIQSD